MKIAVIGECMIELKGKTFGDMTQSFGGDSLNTALYIKRVSDAEVSYVTSVGNDELSNQMVAKWVEEGIDTCRVMFDQKRTCGLYMIHLTEEGERSFSYWRNNSAAKFMCRHESYSQIMDSLSDFDAVYLSGISLAILPPEDRELLLTDLDTLAYKGVKIMFDSNYRPALWESKEAAQAAYKKLYKICDYAFVTDDDEAALWGDSDADMSLTRLRRVGVKNIIVKSGAHGCLFAGGFTENNSTHVPATFIEKVVDTTSAGDSFNAGFIAGLQNGLNPIECCEIGNALAGIVIQNHGAIIPKSETDKLGW